jgi:hypothetical protein
MVLVAGCSLPKRCRSEVHRSPRVDRRQPATSDLKADLTTDLTTG